MFFYTENMSKFAFSKDYEDEELQETLEKLAKYGTDLTYEEFEKNLIHFENHPLVAHKITKLCDINTGSKEVAEIITELTIMMGYEALKDLPTTDIEIEAPLTTMMSPVIEDSFTIVPILRAGLGMVDGLKQLLLSNKSSCLYNFQNIN